MIRSSQALREEMDGEDIKTPTEESPKNSKIILVSYADQMTEEDSYEEGADPDTMETVDRGDLKGEYKSFEELMKAVGVSDKENVGVLDDPGRLIFQLGLVNEHSYEASEKEKEEWKAGNKKLWDMSINVYFSLIEKYKPSPEEMITMFGVQEF